jgi:hypothetical protein
MINFISSYFITGEQYEEEFSSTFHLDTNTTFCMPDRGKALLICVVHSNKKLAASGTNLPLLLERFI